MKTHHKAADRRLEHRRDEFLKLERAFWQAMKDRDGKTAASLTDDGCIVVGPQGVSEIAPVEIGGMVERASYELDEYTLDEANLHLRMIADDVAVVAYPVKERLTVDNRATHLDAIDSSVWVRRDGKWRCALHTETLTGDPFGRDRPSAG